MHVAAADAGPFGLDDDIMRRRWVGLRAVFVGDLVRGMKDEREILIEKECQV